MARRKRKLRTLEPEPITRDWLEYIIHDELCYHQTWEQFRNRHAAEAQIMVAVRSYLDAQPPEALPKFRDYSAFRWLDDRMEELCAHAGVNRYRMPLY